MDICNYLFNKSIAVAIKQLNNKSMIFIAVAFKQLNNKSMIFIAVAFKQLIKNYNNLIGFSHILIVVKAI